MDCECDHDDERVENDDDDDDDCDDDYDDASVGTEPAQGEGADQDVSMSNSDEFCCEVCQVIALSDHDDHLVFLIKVACLSPMCTDGYAMCRN